MSDDTMDDTMAVDEAPETTTFDTAQAVVTPEAWSQAEPEAVTLTRHEYDEGLVDSAAGHASPDLVHRNWYQAVAIAACMITAACVGAVCVIVRNDNADMTAIATPSVMPAPWPSPTPAVATSQPVPTVSTVTVTASPLPTVSTVLAAAPTTTAPPVRTVRYAVTETVGDGESGNGDWYATPCGVGCLQIAGFGTAFLSDGWWTMERVGDADCVRAGRWSDSGNPNAATFDYTWNAATGRGSDRITYNVTACGRRAGSTQTNQLQLIQVP